MVATDKREVISNLLNKLFEYVRSDEFIAEDVKQYADSLIVSEEQAKNIDIEGLLLAYVFERRLDDGRFVMDLFLEKHPDLSQEEKDIVEGLKNSIYSIFEIKKVLKNGFEFYNLVNEKTYPTYAIIKFANFRGVSVGESILGRIFPYEDKYFIIVLNRIFPSAAKSEALRYAVMMQMERPEAVYETNEEKFKEIEDITNELEGKFNEYFNANEIVTTTDTLDEILAGFNDYVETGSREHADNLQELIKKPDDYKYFDITELSAQQGGDFIDKAAQGFSSAPATYDVGLMYDKEVGLLVVPFYNTFKEIFKRDDYQSVEGHKECIKEMFLNDKVPPNVIRKVHGEYPNKFMDLVKEVLEEPEINDIEALLRKYKNDYFDHRKFSVPTMLYSSESFNRLMQVMQEDQLKAHMMQHSAKVGRNDPCPCGSGKKYKKCCMID